MKKCLLCREIREVSEIGYCEDCLKRIKADTKFFKAALPKLRDEARDASDERRAEILQEAQQIETKIDFYSERKAPIPAKAFRATIREIYAICGVKPAGKSKKLFPVLCAALTGLMTVLCIVLAAGLLTFKSQADMMAAIAQEKDAQISDLQGQISNLQSQLEVETAAPARSVYTFESGNYVSGKDFAPGIYDIRGMSGRGTVTSDNYDDLIAVMMRGNNEPDELGLYIKSYDNAYLPEGTTLTVDGVKIKLTLVEEY